MTLTKNKRGIRTFPDWTKVQDAQAQVAESSTRIVLVNTDDLNGDKNDIHYTKEGYKILGKRFAESAIKLIKTNSAK